MNRREFLLRSTGRSDASVVLSCERLYMRYVDARVDGTTSELIKWIEGQLRPVTDLRLLESGWLARQEFKELLDPILGAFRARGGRISRQAD